MSFIVEKHVGGKIIYFDAAFDNDKMPHSIVHKVNEVWAR